MSETKVQMDPSYVIKLTVTLLVTCLVVAAALGGVNMVTEGPIAEANLGATRDAMLVFFPDAANAEFPELDPTDEMTAAADAAGVTISNVYDVVDGGSSIGCGIKLTCPGSQGTIEMVVGLDSEDSVTGVSIISNSETSGIGSKVMNNEPSDAGTPMLDQFIGKGPADTPLAVGTNVDAITGATQSSNGVTTGVNGALAIAQTFG